MMSVQGDQAHVGFRPIADEHTFSDLPRMRSWLVVAMIASSVGCSNPQLRQAKLMDEIERRVALPDGASSLSKYARFYAEGRSGDIVGIYLIPSEPLAPGSTCVQYRSGEQATQLNSKDCASPKGDLDKTSAGQRTWMKREEDLPLVLDGGCGVVRVEYRPSTKTVGVACNGLA